MGVTRDVPGVDAFLAEADAAVADLARAACALVRGLFPETDEAVIPGWNGVGYRHEAGKGMPFAFVGLVKDAVHLHLTGASAFDDRDGLLRGTGVFTRHVRLESPADVAHPGVSRLVVIAAHANDPGEAARTEPRRRARA